MADSKITDWEEVPVDDWEEIPSEDIASYVPSSESSSQPKMSKTESALEGAADSITLGFGEELTAPIAAAVGMTGDLPSLPDEGGIDKYKRLMQLYRDSARERREAGAEQNPWSYGGGALAGGILVPGGAITKGASKIPKALGLIPAAGKTATIGGKIATGAGTGALFGGLYGAGSAEGGISKRLEGAEAGAKLGGAAGIALPVALAATKGLAKGIYTGVKGTFDYVGNMEAIQNASKVFKHSKLGIRLSDKAREITKDMQKIGEEFGKRMNSMYDASRDKREQIIDLMNKDLKTFQVKDKLIKLKDDLLKIKPRTPEEAASQKQLVGVVNDNLMESKIILDEAKMLKVEAAQVKAKERIEKQHAIFTDQKRRLAQIDEARQETLSRAAADSIKKEKFYDAQLVKKLKEAEFGSDEQIVQAVRLHKAGKPSGIPSVIIEEEMRGVPLPSNYTKPKTEHKYGKKVMTAVDEEGQSINVPVEDIDVTKIKTDFDDFGREYYYFKNKESGKINKVYLPADPMQSPVKTIQVPKENGEMDASQLKRLTEDIGAAKGAFGSAPTTSGGIAAKAQKSLEGDLGDEYQQLTQKMSQSKSLAKALNRVGLKKSIPDSEIPSMVTEFGKRLKKVTTDDDAAVEFQRILEEGYTKADGTKTASLKEVAPELAEYLEKQVAELGEKYGIAKVLNGTIQNTTDLLRSMSGGAGGIIAKGAEAAGLIVHKFGGLKREFKKGTANATTELLSYTPDKVAEVSKMVSQYATKVGTPAAKRLAEALRKITESDFVSKNSGEFLSRTKPTATQRALLFGIMQNPGYRESLRKALNDDESTPPLSSDQSQQ